MGFGGILTCPAFLSPSAVRPEPSPKPCAECEGLMPLQTKSDPVFNVRWAAWVAKGVAHDHVLRQRVAAIVPIGVVVVLIIYAVLTH